MKLKQIKHTTRVTCRGASVMNFSYHINAWFRGIIFPDTGYGTVGFRLVRAANETQTTSNP
jgi:hypothetical protein